MRDLNARPANEAEETERLEALLGQRASLAELNSALCEKIRSSEMTLQTPGLLDHLKTTAICQLKVDQPKYSGLKTALDAE